MRKRTFKFRSKIGRVKVKQHRTIEGTAKTVCVRRSATGKQCVSA